MGLVRAFEEDRELPLTLERHCALGLCATGVLSAFFTPSAVASASAAGLALSCMAFLVLAGRARGRLRAVLAATTSWALISMPACAVLVLSIFADPEMAFTIWLPLVMTVFVIALSMLHFDPWRPVLLGVVAAVQYVAVWAWVTAHLPAERIAALESPLHPENTVVHVLWYLGSGGAFALAARRLKRALGDAERRARQTELFGKYRLGDTIACGGMASVVAATYCPEGGFERPAAIKRIHAHLARDPAFVASFRREAEIGARLAHPNIVAVLDFGCVDDTWFLAMERIEGHDLRDLLNRLHKLERAVPPALAGLIAREVLHGLAFAHEGARDRDGRALRVVHRDLTPANVMITRAGDVKITDFGIATALFEDEMHETRRIIGSVAYLAPEQVARAPFDHRADLYAVGVVLWEMLAGRRLWKRETEGLTLGAILYEEAPLVQWLGVSAAWDALLARALAKDPARRFTSAREMVDAIGAVVAAEPGGARAEDLARFLADTMAPTVSATEATVPARVAAGSRTEGARTSGDTRTTVDAAPATIPLAA